VVEVCECNSAGHTETMWKTIWHIVSLRLKVWTMAGGKLTCSKTWECWMSCRFFSLKINTRGICWTIWKLTIIFHVMLYINAILKLHYGTNGHAKYFIEQVKVSHLNDFWACCILELLNFLMCEERERTLAEWVYIEEVHVMDITFWTKTFYKFIS
jgi:hypothetical protein